MSICSKSDDSDVYLFGRSEGFYCHRCTVSDAADVCLPDALAALAHLENHRAAGDLVPDKAFDRLQAEASVAPGRLSA
jgi:hypothetical protein